MRCVVKCVHVDAGLIMVNVKISCKNKFKLSVASLALDQLMQVPQVKSRLLP